MPKIYTKMPTEESTTESCAEWLAKRAAIREEGKRNPDYPPFQAMLRSQSAHAAKCKREMAENTEAIFLSDDFATVSASEVEEDFFRTVRQNILLKEPFIFGSIARNHALSVDDIAYIDEHLPARCALLRLVNEGILYEEDPGTFRVPPFDVNLMFSACRRRYLLEVAAGLTWQLHRHTPSVEQGLAQLEELNYLFSTDAAEARSVLDYIERDLEIHSHIIGGAGMANYSSAVRHDQQQMFIWNPSITVPERRASIFVEHKNILETLNSGDPGELRAAFLVHFQRAQRDWMPDAYLDQFDGLWKELASIEIDLASTDVRNFPLGTWR